MAEGGARGVSTVRLPRQILVALFGLFAPSVLSPPEKMQNSWCMCVRKRRSNRRMPNPPPSCWFYDSLVGMGLTAQNHRSDRKELGRPTDVRNSFESRLTSGEIRANC